ncbi:MAG: GDYXXLXY domain-containing protein [bacterium]
MKRNLLYALLCLQIVGLAVLYGFYAAGLSSPSYLLETEPVDPRDYFRGDYIILNYKISRLPEHQKNSHFRENQNVDVTLKKTGDFWVIRNVTDSMPPTKDFPVLRARLSGDTLLYDIEKYFVPEGEGNPRGKITVAIVIRPDGQAQIKQLYNDGKPWP